MLRVRLCSFGVLVDHVSNRHGQLVDTHVHALSYLQDSRTDGQVVWTRMCMLYLICRTAERT